MLSGVEDGSRKSGQGVAPRISFKVVAIVTCLGLLLQLNLTLSCGFLLSFVQGSKVSLEYH